MTDEMVAWIREQIDEDERVALAVSNGPNKPEKWTAKQYKDGMRNWRVDGQHSCVIDGAFQHDAEHIARHDPAGVLNDVAAKRRLLDECVSADAALTEIWMWETREGGYSSGLDRAVRILALSYTDRPGYRAEWRPST